jgi:transcriptional regulator with XRE-family HTH domain
MLFGMSDQNQLDPTDPTGPLADVYTLPNTLRQWRDLVGWSQEDLERASGVSQKTISEIEVGRNKRPQDGTLIAFARAFGAALDLEPDALLKDLKAARAHTPGTQVSEFSQRLDNLISGLKPVERIFMEQALMDHFYAIKKALDYTVSVTKKSRRKK